MGGRLKIKEIAAQTGLSISTVSRVLAGKANASAKVKQQVLECAASQGVLAGMSAGRFLFNNLTVFAPSRAFDVRTDIFYYRVVQGVRDAVANHDVRVGYCGLDEHDCDVQLFFRKINDPGCEAAIIVGIDDPRVHEVAADLGKPCVLVNCMDRAMRLDAVLPDHQQIGEYSAGHLIQQGHRDILTLICLRRFTLERRLNGIRDAFAANHMQFEEQRHLVTTSGFSAEEAEQAIDRYLDACPPAEYPSAILAGGDFMASGAISALQKRNYAVPGDFSVMSIDGFNLASIHDISLTSAHVPREELGQEAIGLLQRRLMRPSAPPCNLLLCGRLAPGESVKRIGNRRLKPAISTKDHGLYKG